ncbi:MAG TPA: sigma-70 family RNA polymerase sigma factor [Solirubrobacteraceae bacterium]|jgi:RNA polymerase sigma-70 factor (ECF subfamily)|nr:sigma-70 family RNA polymerase sigma factor [Solirubrobacteraceae bacterium]
MSDTNWLAAQFEEHRGRLVAIAQRMLGSAGEADDAVQEVWIRLNRSDAEAIEHLGGWLTTVLSRVCFSMLQSRRARPEMPVGSELPEPVLESVSGSDPEQEALIAESIGLAMLVVLDRLAPAERVAFVLHDVFAIPFEEIAPIVDRTPAAARKLASRARQRIQRADPPDHPDRLRHATVIDAFLAAARRGDFDALLGVLDPDIVVRADDEASALGAAQERHGAATVAEFLQRAYGAMPALVDGVPSAVWMPGGQLRVLFSFTIQDQRIVRIDLVADPARLRQLDVVLADTQPPQAGR